MRPAAGPAEHHVRRRQHRWSDRPLPAERERHLRLGGARLPAEPGCYGICVPDVPQTGCQVNTDCPTGQVCNVACREWGCVPGGTGTGTPTDPATGMTAPPGAACACDLTDNSCVCDASGACKGRTCVGQCVLPSPPPPTCNPNKPVACPTIAIACPNGLTPMKTGVDPNTCCETYTCPVCDRARGGEHGRGQHLPGDPLRLRQGGRHGSGELLPEVRVRAGQGRRDLRVATALRERLALTLALSPLRGERGLGSGHRRLLERRASYGAPSVFLRRYSRGLRRP